MANSSLRCVSGNHGSGIRRLGLDVCFDEYKDTKARLMETTEKKRKREIYQKGLYKVMH